MKQVILIAVCVLLVMLVGYTVQKENLVFGPMAVVTDSLPPEKALEEALPNLPPEPALILSPFVFSGSGEEPEEANAGAPHPDGR